MEIYELTSERIHETVEKVNGDLDEFMQMWTEAQMRDCVVYVAISDVFDAVFINKAALASVKKTIEDEKFWIRRRTDANLH